MTTTASARRVRTPLRTLSRSSWVDVAVLSALSMLSILGFEPAFGPYNYLLAGIGGLVIGTAAALAGFLFRLGVIPTALIGFAAYVVFGSPLTMPNAVIAHVVPTATSILGLFQGAVFGWADIVTLQTPVEAPDYIAVVPYFATWLVGLVSVSIACRWLPARPRTTLRAAVLLVPAIALYLTGILIGTAEPFFAGIRGVAFAVIALVWLGWRRRNSGAVTITVDPAAQRRKLAGVAVVVLGAMVLGGAGGLLLGPKPASRFVLRQEVTPPFDPLEYPSPLTGYRNFTKKLVKTQLFTVKGLQEGQRIRMATLDSYDGRVWSVASPAQQTDGSGGFELLGRNIPTPPLVKPGAHSSLTFTIDGYNDVWLPDAQYPTTLDFDRYTGVDPTTTVRINTVTGAAAVTSGVKKGLEYTVGVTIPSLPTDKALATVPTAKIELPPVSNVPDVVAAKATEYAGSAKTSIQQLRNIEKSLKTIGYLSHGLASDPVPSRAGEGSDRMSELFTKAPMVGDEEQYASAFALMARSLNYPARVVMGFAPKVSSSSSVTPVTGKDVTAWVEVAFAGVGWVPFYPTPTKTDAPQEQTTKPKIEPQPQVRQPPPSNQKQNDILTPVKISNKNPKAKPAGFELPGWAWLVGGIVGIPLLAYFGPLLVIAGLKRRRRNHRFTAGSPDRRAAGSWDELEDRYGELGFELPSKATRLQTASALQSQGASQGLVMPESGFGGLATIVDTAVFSASDVDENAVDAVWRQTESATSASLSSAGWLRRRIASFRFHRRKTSTPARTSRRSVKK